MCRRPCAPTICLPAFRNGHCNQLLPLHLPACLPAEEALADPYFAGLSQPSREPSAQPISKLAFEFERRKLVVEEVRCACCALLCMLCPAVLWVGMLWASCCCALPASWRWRRRGRE